MWIAFANLLTFLSKNISVYAIFNDQSFNDTLTNDIVSFKELGPDKQENIDAKHQYAGKLICHALLSSV